MSGASEKATEAAITATGGVYGYGGDKVRIVLKAAHNPKLGPEASVRLGDVLDLLRSRRTEMGQEWGAGFAAFIEREHREGRLGT